MVTNDVMDIPILLKGNVQSVFRVQLPFSFPQQPPAVYLLAPQGTHQNLGPNQVVQHYKLLKWGVHSNLALILSEIFQLFINEPPSQKTLENTNLSFNGSFSSGSGSFSGMNNSSFSNQQTSSFGVQQNNSFKNSSSNLQKSNQIRMISIPQSYSQIQTLPENQQKILLQSDSDFKFFFKKLDVIKEIDAIKDSVKSENSDIATKHLAREQEFMTLREEVKKYQSEVAQTKRLFEEKQKLQNDKKSIYSTPFLKNALQEKLDENDENSHQMSSDFLSGKIDAESFLNDFIKERNIYYERKTKLDRFQ